MRITWIDAWKGELILFVVLGHLVGAAAHVCAPEHVAAYGFLHKFFYVFHMHAFFFLSGWLHKPESNGFLCLASKKTKRLLVPYWLFGAASLLLYWVAGTGFAPSDPYFANRFAGGVSRVAWELAYGGPYEIGANPFPCNSVLWFLPTLFVVGLLYSALERGAAAIRLTGVRFACCCAAAFAGISWFFRCGLIPPLPFCFNRATFFVVFYALGHALSACAPKNFPERHVRFARWACLPAWGILWVLCQVTPDHGIQASSFGWHCAFLGIAFAGVVASLLTALAFVCRQLAACGVASLAIMLMHKPIVVALQFAVKPVRAFFAGGWLEGAFACALIAATAVVCCMLVRRALVRFAPWSLGERRTPRAFPRAAAQRP